MSVAMSGIDGTESDEPRGQHQERDPDSGADRQRQVARWRLSWRRENGVIVNTDSMQVYSRLTS